MLSDLGQKVLEHHFVDWLGDSSISIQKTLDLVQTNTKIPELTNQCNLPNIHNNAYIQIQSASRQLKLTTDFFMDESRAYQQLKAIDTVIARNVEPDVVPWPMSYLPPNIRQPQNYNTPRTAAQIGVRFVLPESLLERLYEQVYQEQYATYIDFKNEVYVHLAQNIYRNLYLLIYFFGATPTARPNDIGFQRSALQSQRYLETTSLKDFKTYIASLKQAATLVIPAALKAPLFLRPKASDPEFRDGVQYLELHIFDIQPSQSDGLYEYQLQFIRLFLLNALLEGTATNDELTKQLQLALDIAVENPEVDSPVKAQLKNGLTKLANFNEQYLKRSDYITMLQKLTNLLDHPKDSQAQQLATSFSEVGAYTYGLQLAQKNKRMMQETEYQLRGYTDYSLATQQVLSSSIKRGLHFRFLSQTTELLQVKSQKAQTFIHGGQQTTKNPLVLQTMLQDPQVINQLCSLAQIAMAQTFVSADLPEAKSLFQQYFTQQPLIIRPQNQSEPKATQIFTRAIDLDTFTKAFLMATDYDENVVIQAYIPGSTYEFYVLDQQVLSVVEKVPENIVGDGHSDISTLMTQKNDDARRGHLGQKPLLALEPDKEVQNFLKQEGLDLHTVPDRGIQILLSQRTDRQAGADTFSVLDEVDASYQKLVLQISEILQLHQGSIEMVIPNIYQEYQPLQNQAIVTAISAEPDLITHSFPYMGPTQNIADRLLASLLPNLRESKK